jgi:hypothetical protein
MSKIENLLIDQHRGFRDETSERYIVAQALYDPASFIPELEQAGITAEHFVSDQASLVWETIVLYRDKGELNKLEQLGDDAWILRESDTDTQQSREATDLWEALVALDGLAPSPAPLLKESIRKLKECHLKRISYRFSKSLEEVESTPVDELVANIKTFSAEIQQEADWENNKTLPKIVSFDQHMKQYPDKPESIIEGVLGRGDKLILSASSKAGKTWLMLHLAYAIENGGIWLGHQCKQAHALYVNFELAEVWAANRMKLISGGGQYTEHPDTLNLRGYETTWKSLSAHIKTHIENSQKEYGIIILDPIYKMLGDNDENANGDIGKLLNSLERMGHENKAAVAFSHHHSKGNKSNVDAVERMSGAGTWGRDPDAIIDMVSHEEEDCYTVEAITRNYIKPPKLVVRCEFPHFVVVDDANPELLRKPGGSKKKLTKADVVFMCEQTPVGITKPKLIRKLAEAYSTSEETSRKRVKDALDNELIKMDNKLIKPVTSTDEANLIQSHSPKSEDDELGITE